MPPAALVAARVSKRYGGRRLALDGADLTIPAGSITALVGPNGAGKSTLIRLWIGFERPDQGVLRVMEADPSRDPAAVRRAIGHVPQTSFLYREFSIREHLDLACSLRPSFDRSLAEARLAEMGLALGQRVDQLSGGERSQVALSLALATRAPVLLLDEPLASIDPLARREFLHVLVGAVQATGQTVVMSSQVVGDVEQACDRIVVLGSGRVLISGAINEVVRSHRTSSDHGGSGEAIGRFPDLTGRELVLLRVTDLASTQGRPATLEDVVLGYLAAGRQKHPRAS